MTSPLGKGSGSRLLFLAVALLLLPAAAPGPRLEWFRGNTHTHTVNSDGRDTPDAVVRWYREHDYQFLFLTDHEFLTDVGPLNALFGAQGRFLLLPGQEVTQWGADPARSAAHVNGLFVREVVWPVGERRCVGSGCGAHAAAEIPLADTFRTNIARIRQAGGIAQINHPNYRWSVKPTDLDDVPDGALIEIWNGLGSINNLGGDDGNGDVRPSSEGYWDYLLSRGKLIWGVGSDDSHNEEGRGHAWIMVRAAELTPAAIRTALESGNFYASTGVTLKDVVVGESELSIKIDERKPGAIRYRTQFIGQDGKILSDVGGAYPTYRFSGSETYVRAAIIDSNGKRAWTQPVFRDERRHRVTR